MENQEAQQEAQAAARESGVYLVVTGQGVIECATKKEVVNQVNAIGTAGVHAVYKGAKKVVLQAQTRITF